MMRFTQTYSVHEQAGETTYDLNFTNKELDRDLGLNYFGARYYHPELPRFLSVDPIGGKSEIPISWNRYLYCRNDPVNMIDPDGEQETDTNSYQNRTITVFETAKYELKVFLKTITLGALDYTDVGDAKIALTGSDFSEKKYSAINNATRVTKQSDGANVYIQRVGGRKKKYNVVIEGEDGVVTGMKSLSAKELKNLGNNHGFDPKP